MDGKPRALDVNDGYDWIAGKGTPKTFTIKPAGRPSRFTDVGDFEKDQGFSIGAWVKIPRRGNTGASPAAWTTPNKFRGWDFWIEQDKIGMHIINDWPDNALKVTRRRRSSRTNGITSSSPTTAPRKAAGVKVYINGKSCSRVDVFTDKLTGYHQDRTSRSRSANGTPTTASRTSRCKISAFTAGR